MLTSEDGPFAVFERLRNSIPTLFNPLSCFACTSVWVAALFCLLFQIPLFFTLVLSAAAMLVNKVYEM